MALLAGEAAPPLPRCFGATNARGLWTLYRRGVVRHFRYGWETLGGALVSSLLFLTVFVLAAGAGREVAPGLEFSTFIVPGIVIFSLCHAAFEGAAVGMIYDKHEGMIGDVLGAPLSPLEILAGYVLSAATNALATGGLILGATLLFVDLPGHNLAIAAAFATGAALLFSLLGLLVGIWADRWEHYSAVESFLVLPLGFLSGTFFTLASVPEALRWLIALNPVLYAVDGLRHGLTGFSETSLGLGAGLLLVISLSLWLLVWRLLVIGYKLKP